MALTLTSQVIKNGDLIPQQYTCDGKDISPPLAWNGTPEGTKSYVLIVDDPDAPMGTWDHWLLFNLPGNTTELPEAISTLPEGTVEGSNSWNNTGYGGPCPPDREHRYSFKLYALDTLLNLGRGAKKQEIESAMHNHILEEAQLMGRYDRAR